MKIEATGEGYTIQYSMMRTKIYLRYYSSLKHENFQIYFTRLRKKQFINVGFISELFRFEFYQKPIFNSVFVIICVHIETKRKIYIYLWYISSLERSSDTLTNFWWAWRMCLCCWIFIASQNFKPLNNMQIALQHIVLPISANVFFFGMNKKKENKRNLFFSIFNVQTYILKSTCAFNARCEIK